MPSVYVIAVVPVGKKAASDTALKGYTKGGASKAGADPLSAAVVPLGGADDATPTHYGFCWGVDEQDNLKKQIEAFKQAQAGAEYHVVPFKEYDHQTHWVDWLAGLGLKPRQEKADDAVKK